MSEAVVVKTNIPDFRKQLAELGTRFERRVATRASRAAALVFRNIAREIAPERTGELRRGIYVGRSRESRPGKVVYFVSVRSFRRRTAVARLKRRRAGLVDPFYWRFQEGGWVPRGRGRGFRGGARRRTIERNRAIAAGARRVSNPFLAPAFSRGGSQALQAFNAEMERGIAEEARRGGR
jgi:hypothetical protein